MKYGKLKDGTELTDELAERARARAEREGKSLSELAREAIEAYVGGRRT